VSALEERGVQPAAATPPAKPGPAPKIEARPAAAPAPVPAPAEPVGEKAHTNGDVTIQKVRSAWQSIRTRVESERQSLRTQLSRAVPEAIEGNALVIKLPNAVLADTLKDNAKMIEDAILEVLGTPLRARFKVEAGAKAAAPPEDPEELLSYINERMS